MTLAHVAGVPIEELFALMPAVGAFWVALRNRRASRVLTPPPSGALQGPQ